MHITYQSINRHRGLWLFIDTVSLVLPNWKCALVWHILYLWEPMLYIAYQANKWQQASLMLHWYSQSLPIHAICLHWFNGKCWVISLLSTSSKVVLSYNIFIPIFSLILTYWCRYEIAAISKTTFLECIFSNETVRISLGMSLKFVLRFELTIFQHWFRQWFGAEQATSHYLN